MSAYHAKKSRTLIALRKYMRDDVIDGEEVLISWEIDSFIRNGVDGLADEELLRLAKQCRESFIYETDIQACRLWNEIVYHGMSSLPENSGRKRRELKRLAKILRLELRHRESKYVRKSRAMKQARLKL